eukprot:CAMPEP_0183738516 /NCGR_PEP_ID=MMETSP0737-20130205/54773_1 /TAXON_ID=385413 /ORGANISM="Thalassiosira miniscula, Strain CCMP1093" /LENGTH=303 /DNA_ID=CAMNT_0025973067 /DNA_START=241 /DNA_END=1152 /DNA_ORIENTATION=+
MAAPVALKPDQVPEDMVCSICMALPLDPILTPCEHVFCAGCIYQALDRCEQCPIDRTACTIGQLKPLRGFVHRIWNNIQVKCGNHNNGCAWTGSIGDYSSHMNHCRRTNSADGAILEELQQVKKKLEKLQLENDRLEEENDGLEEENEELGMEIELLKHKVKTYARLQGENARLKKRVESIETRIAPLERRTIMLEANNASLKAELQNRPNLSPIFEYSYRRENVVQLSQLISSHLGRKPKDIDSNKIFNCIRSCYIDLQKDYSDNPKNYRGNMKMLLAVCQASKWFTPRQQENFKRWFEEQF